MEMFGCYAIDEDMLDEESRNEFTMEFAKQSHIWSAASGADAAALSLAWVLENYHIYKKESSNEAA